MEWISFIYMVHNCEGPPTNIVVRKMPRIAKAKGISIVTGADSNAHHHIWGSSAAIKEMSVYLISNEEEVLDIARGVRRYACQCAAFILNRGLKSL